MLLSLTAPPVLICSVILLEPKGALQWTQESTSVFWLHCNGMTFTPSATKIRQLAENLL